MLAEIDAHERYWWSVLLLLWAAAPAQRVVDVLKAIPGPSVGCHVSPEDDAAVEEEIESGGRPGEPLDQASQRRLLRLLRHDPLLAATGGLRRAARSRLLKRLLGGVEAARQVAAGELVEALAEDMAAPAAAGAVHKGGDCADDEEEDWQYKTFAYGPMQPPVQSPVSGAAAAGAGGGGGDGQQPALPLPVPLPPPIPEAVVQRHVLGLSAALGRQHVGEAMQELPDSCTSEPAIGAAAPNPHAQSCGSNDGSAHPCGLISLRVSGNMLAGSTGCHEWEASFALAQLVLRRPDLFKGRRVLELGAGAGLVGVALARAGAQLVAATDGSAQAVSNCAANLRLNLLPQQHPILECGQVAELATLEQGVAVCRLAWEEPLPPGGLRCDTVVASDVLYDPEVVPVLVSLLVRLLQPAAEASYGDAGGADVADSLDALPAPRCATPVAYIATLRRNPATLQLFLETAASAGLHLAEVDGWGDKGAHEVRFHLGVLDDKAIAERIVVHRVVRATAC